MPLPWPNNQKIILNLPFARNKFEIVIGYYFCFTIFGQRNKFKFFLKKKIFFEKKKNRNPITASITTFNIRWLLCYGSYDCIILIKSDNKFYRFPIQFKYSIIFTTTNKIIFRSIFSVFFFLFFCHNFHYCCCFCFSFVILPFLSISFNRNIRFGTKYMRNLIYICYKQIQFPN